MIKYGDISPRTAGYAAKSMLEAIRAGTNVFYASDSTDDDECLYICGVNCNGIKPTASDPLAQRICPLADVHNRVSGRAVRECYKPRVIDQMVAQEVKRIYPSKAYNQMWGYDDDPEEWQET